MTEDIVTDSEVKDEETPIQTPHSKRLEEIAARRREQEGIKEEVEPEPEPEPTEKPDMVDLIGDDGSVIQIPKKAKYKGKIDGQEVEIPFDDMASSYQVRAAAQKRLEQASLKQKELEAKEQELAKRGTELSEREQSYLDKMKEIEAKKDKGVISEDSRKKLAGKLLHAFSESETPLDDLEQVLTELIPGQPTVDYDKIKEETRKETLAEIERRENERAELAKKKADEQLEKARIEANEKFETEYKDIIDDPILYAAAGKIANKKWAETPDADPWTIAQEVGNEVREWIKAKTPTKEVKKPSPTPKSVSARAKVGEDKKPQTRLDILKEMRQARGQPN